MNRNADSKGTASLMARHDIVPLGHNTSASGHAEGAAPDSSVLSGRLQGWKALDPLWDSVAEDVRDIGIGRERGNIGIGKEREAFF